MTRFDLVSTPTPDGRRVILRAVPISRRERLRRLAARILRGA
jgi:hypothetical protein